MQEDGQQGMKIARAKQREKERRGLDLRASRVKRSEEGRRWRGWRGGTQGLMTCASSR